MDNMFKTQQNFSGTLDGSSMALETRQSLSPKKKPGTSYGPSYTMSVKEIVDHSLKVKPFGIDMYEVPKVERAYLLKPHYGK